MFSPNMDSNQFWQSNDDYGGAGQLMSVFQLQPSSHITSDHAAVPIAATKDVPPRGAIDLFINRVQEMPSGRTQAEQENLTSKQKVESFIHHDQMFAPRPLDVPRKVKLSQSQIVSTPEMFMKPKNADSESAGASEFLRALELSHELRRHFEMIPERHLSLVADRDAHDVHVLLDSMERLCNKISAIFPCLQPGSSQMDQNTYILVFAAVMEVIDQTIRRLGCLLELEPRFDPGPTTFDSMISGDFDMSTDSLSYASETAEAHDEFSFLSRYASDELACNMMRNDGEGSSINFADIKIEHIVALTRLDYYLFRFKSFISRFDSTPDFMSPTMFMFSPSESTARLLSFHRCIEFIHSGWKARWGR
jgi:hypothetical protein